MKTREKPAPGVGHGSFPDPTSCGGAEPPKSISASPRKSVSFRFEGAESAAYALGAALALGRDPEAWAAASAVWRWRLTDAERAAVAWAALRTLPPDTRVAILGALDPEAGPPLPSITPPMQAARWWATVASRAELRAYSAAAFEALPAADRRRFLTWATTPREVAA